MLLRGNEIGAINIKIIIYIEVICEASSNWFSNGISDDSNNWLDTFVSNYWSRWKLFSKRMKNIHQRNKIDGWFENLNFE